VDVVARDALALELLSGGVGMPLPPITSAVPSPSNESAESPLAMGATAEQW